METRNEAAKEKPRQESNPLVISPTSWFWNPLSYLWGNPASPTDEQQASGEIISNANVQEENDRFFQITPQESHLLSQQYLTAQQQTVKPPVEENQPEETLAQQETLESSLPDMQDMSDLFGSQSTVTPAEIVPEPTSTVNDSKTSTLTESSCVSYAFRPATPSSENDPHPGQAFENRTATEGSGQYTLATAAETSETSTELEEEQDRLRREQEARAAAIQLQQEQQAMLLQREQEQKRAELQAAEERRKAEDAFSRSCSTGARTLEEHYRLARAAVMRAGF